MINSSSSSEKTKFDEEFNFETMKSLDKEDILKEIQEKSAATINAPVDDDENEHGDYADHHHHGHHGHHHIPIPQPITAAYNKESSFFDSLSTDNTDKTGGKRMTRQEREEQKKLNMETFGESGSDMMRSGGYRRGGRGGSGGGSGGSRGGRGGGSHHHHHHASRNGTTTSGRGGGRGGSRFASN